VLGIKPATHTVQVLLEEMMELEEGKGEEERKRKMGRNGRKERKTEEGGKGGKGEEKEDGIREEGERRGKKRKNGIGKELKKKKKKKKKIKLSISTLFNARWNFSLFQLLRITSSTSTYPLPFLTNHHQSLFARFLFTHPHTVIKIMFFVIAV
jgi:hypothetical protein